MNKARTLLGVAVAAAISLGYVASQFAFFQGRAPEYAKAVDTPAIAWVATLAFVALIALAVADNRGEPE